MQGDSAWPEPFLLPLYQAIYDHLVIQLSLRWRPEAGGAARELLDAMLQLGPTETEYVRMLNDMSDILPPEAGAADYDALMELAELTVSNASPNPDARQRLGLVSSPL